MLSPLSSTITDSDKTCRNIRWRDTLVTQDKNWMGWAASILQIRYTGYPTIKTNTKERKSVLCIHRGTEQKWHCITLANPSVLKSALCSDGVVTSPPSPGRRYSRLPMVRTRTSGWKEAVPSGLSAKWTRQQPYVIPNLIVDEKHNDREEENKMEIGGRRGNCPVQKGKFYSA